MHIKFLKFLSYYIKKLTLLFPPNLFNAELYTQICTDSTFLDYFKLKREERINNNLFLHK